ncbi:uncharacterized protein ARMOST_18857 [Armillaria ostoyae]|uniref:DUF6534 domain-containing protein n=1 Tax=Armillaria ostoyae TaxID=47428 RepID=A0A284S304_ARMOS|nr:uncharacterized protein ARMOST_18857 [Armillaria ostoyae]
MSSQPPKAILGETLGALYVGATIAAVLFGITNLQAVIYYKRYPSDWWVYRYSVAVLWILDALHVALTTHALYFYLVDMFGDLTGALVHSELQGDFPTVPTIDLSNGSFHTQVQLGINLITPPIPSGAGIFVTYNIFITQNFTVIAAIKEAVYTVFATVAATDFVIALMMCYYLHKCRAATDFSSTASFLLNLMRLVVVSGLATSACSLLTLICFIAWPHSLIFLGIDFILPKLYVNSLLAMFNYRPEHLESTIENRERAGHSTPSVLRIAPQTFEGSNPETDVSIPPSEIQDNRSFEDKLDRSKVTLDHHQV